MKIASATIRILDPVGVVEETPGQEVLERVRRADMHPQLDGAVLGVLTNVFRGYDIPGTVAERIKQLNRVADIKRHAKPSISRPAGEAAYDTLVAAGIDAAVLGLGG